MTSFIGAVILGLVALIAAVLNKTYHHVPLKELKRQARRGDGLAKVLYRAVAHGDALSALMFMIITLAAAGSSVLLVISLPAWLAFVLIAVLISSAFLWLPASHLSASGVRLSVWLTPAISWVLHYGQPLFAGLGRLSRGYYPWGHSNALYETDDLLELLDWQREQPDSHIPFEALAIAEHALTFGNKQVSDIYIPRRSVKTVSSTDSIGPVLMGELHDSGHSSFPVVEGKPGHVVGTLYLNDLVTAQHGGKVSSLMKRDVHYVHEDFSLEKVLSAFLKTKRHLFVVVNNFEEFVGVVTTGDILKQLLGQVPVEEFDRYDSLPAVVESQTKPQPVERPAADIELSDDQLSENVVE